MSNNKTFKIKNGLHAGRYLGTNGTETASSDGPDGAFSTTLYTGNAGTQTITNNINLSGDGGLVWTKSRTNAAHNELTDTVRGGGSNGNALRSCEQDVQGLGDLESFTTSGFVLGYNSADGNSNGQSYVSWTFKETSKFFDIVTYTGDGSNNRAISHNLGAEPGMIFCKRYAGSGNGNWGVYHRSTGNTQGLTLNTTSALGAMSINSETINSSSFGVSGGGYALDNNNGDSYVAYLFGHDTSSTGNILCGSYTGNSAGDPNTDQTLTFGWEPSLMMIKKYNAISNWIVLDSARGMTVDGTPDNSLAWNSTAVEQTDEIGHAISTGFVLTGGNANNNGDTYIYMAIRSVAPKQTLDLSTGHTFSITPSAATTIAFTNPPASGVAMGFTLVVDNSGGHTLTWPSSIKFEGGTAPTTSSTKELYAFITIDGGTTYFGKKAGQDIS
jgi:hypothetical protein